MKSKMSKVIHVVEEIFGLIGIIMILVETYAVFARNVLKIATPWSDELLKLLFVWIIFVGSALAFSTDSLIALTLIEDSEKVKKKPAVIGVLKLIQYVSCFGISALLVKQVSTIMATQIKTGEMTTVMKYPLWLLNLGIFVGMLMICVFAILKIMECKKYFVKPTEK